MMTPNPWWIAIKKATNRPSSKAPRIEPSREAIEVRIQAFSEAGLKTAERTLVLEPGHRLVDVLDGPSLFGLGFEQVKGHLRIVSQEPVLVFALFGDFDSQFLSSIEGQAPIQ